jgi:hypothetical protein
MKTRQVLFSIACFLNLCLVSHAAQIPTQKLVSKDPLPENAKKMYDILHQAFEDGGVGFLAHAKNYEAAVKDLESKLASKNWEYREIADACERVGIVLDRTRTILVKLDSGAFNSAYEQATSLLREQIFCDQAELETAQTQQQALEKLQKERELNPVESSALLDYKTAAKTAEFRLKHYHKIEAAFSSLKDSVLQRNTFLSEMADVHKHLANVYLNLAKTIRMMPEANAITEMLNQISLESKSLQEKIRTTRGHMEAVLNRLEEEVGRIQSLNPVE